MTDDLDSIMSEIEQLQQEMSGTPVPATTAAPAAAAAPVAIAAPAVTAAPVATAAPLQVADVLADFPSPMSPEAAPAAEALAELAQDFNLDSQVAALSEPAPSEELIGEAVAEAPPEELGGELGEELIGEAVAEAPPEELGEELGGELGEELIGEAVAEAPPVEEPVKPPKAARKPRAKAPSRAKLKVVKSASAPEEEADRLLAEFRAAGQSEDGNSLDHALDGLSEENSGGGAIGLLDESSPCSDDPGTDPEVPMQDDSHDSNHSNEGCLSLELRGNMTLKLKYEFEGQEVTVGFSGGALKVTLADGTEFKVPVASKRHLRRVA